MLPVYLFDDRLQVGQRSAVGQGGQTGRAHYSVEFFLDPTLDIGAEHHEEDKRAEHRRGLSRIANTTNEPS